MGVTVLDLHPLAVVSPVQNDDDRFVQNENQKELSYGRYSARLPFSII